MAKQSINLGSSANDGTGTTIRAGGDIVNDNFNELYTAIGTGSNLQITVSGASNGQALIYSSSNSRFEPANQSGGLSDIVGDTSPQLGGDLDVNSNGIISASNGNIPITPNGSGEIQLDGLKWPTSDGGSSQFLQTNGAGQLAFATVLQNVAEDTSPQLGANLDVQTNEITTSTSNGNIKLNPNGTGVVEVKGDGSSADGTVQLNCSQNSHGIKLASPPHSAAQSYTLTFPQTAPVANKLLQTDGSGNLSFSSDLTLDSLTMSGSGNVTFTAATTLALNANTGGTVVVNDGSNNADFRVESDNNANMLFVDAGSDHVNIGTSTDLGAVLNVSGTGIFQTADNTNTLSLISTDADENAGPNLRLYRNSGTPAVNDILGNIDFSGRNANSEDIKYGYIEMNITDPSDGSEDGYMSFNIMQGGANNPFFQMKTGADPVLVVNENSKDMDFRIESDGNANMFKVDAGNNQVLIGGTAATFGELGITGTGNGDANIDMYASVGSGSLGKAEIFFSTDSSSDHVSIASIVAQQPTGDEASRKGEILFNVADNGGPATAMTIQNNKNVLIGTTTTYDGELFRVNKDGTNNVATFTASNDGGAGQVTITNSFSAASSTDENAVLRFGLGNGGSAIRAYKVSDTQTAANRDVGLQFLAQDDNSEQVRFQIANNGDLSATDTSIGSLSDARLKKDIEDLTYSIDTFKALKPRTFNWKNPWLHGQETNRRGFVAQELKEADPYWVSEQKATKKPDDILDPATYYEEGDELPSGKSIGDIKTEATYSYQYADGDGSDYDLLNDGSDLDNKELIAKLGKKDAMYISVIQQLIARIETLEG